MADQRDRHPWLDLLHVDGPFLSRPALDDVYDDAWPPKVSNEIRDLLEPSAELPSEWDEPTMERVNRLLTDVLGYREGRTLKFNPGTVIHPVYDKAAVSPHAAAYSRRDPDTPRLVVLAGPAAAETPDSLDPEAITTHYGWPSTAVQRAALAARGLGADLALVTNGWQHLVVWVGSGITGWAWVDPKNYRLDRRLADAFVALLSAASVTTDADTSTADVLRLSQEKQVDVTEKLGIQVRQAAEALVNAVSRANRNTDGKLLAGVAPNEVYAGVVTVLMRTVFLLNAEERDLISSGDLWDQTYSVSALLDQLDDDHYRHQGVMRRQHGAWLRLLAAARAVHGGVNHAQMNVPAYGGNLFDPVRHPFLEGVGVDGEIFDVGVVDDATTRHVLELLQRLNGQRLSYRAFSVEQIGQVYESLLDHSAVSVPEGSVVLGLVGSKGAEPEVELADLEEQHAKGKLADWLAKEHDPASGKGKVDKWKARIARTPDERVTATLSQACHGRPEVLDRVKRFVSLLRADARDVALVFLPGDVYVTETSDRRDTGTAYTSPEFAAEIAHHALEHLVYEPGPHNEEDVSKWQIKRPDEILELRVCDPAVGSGAILVAAVRYLADKLVESRLEHGELTDRELETAAVDPMATDPYVQARRDVVSQCIYAVDRDPMAVEMAKLSLWLITMAHGRPFTFLDHAIRCGDSLLGVTSLDQLRRLHLDPTADTQIGLDLLGGNAEGLGGYFTMIDECISQVLALRELVRDGDVRDAAEAGQRAELNAKADRLLGDLRLVADAITAVCYRTAGSKGGMTESELRDHVLPMAADLELNREPLAMLGRTRPADSPNAWEFMHWAIEFPEVIRSGGFSAVVGNPPFLGGKRIKTAAGERYRKHLVRYVVGGESRATTDLVAYFFRRCAKLAKSFGLIATDSISQGDSRLVGLRGITGQQGVIHRADSSVPWPGRDAVFVARVWWSREWSQDLSVLDGQTVTAIESDLFPAGRVQGEPFVLKDHEPASVGVFMRGSGFVVSEDEAQQMLRQDPASGDVLVSYRNGDDLNSTSDHSGSRMAINFGRMTAEEASRYEAPFRHLSETVREQRQKAEGRAKEYWWQYAGPKQSLQDRLQAIDHAIVFVRHTAYPIPIRVETGPLFSDACVILPWDDWLLYGILTSEVHGVWVRRYSSTLGGTIRYSHTDTFATMPLPGSLTTASAPGESSGIPAFATVNPPAAQRVVEAIRALQDSRAQVMSENGIGLTQLYGDVHDENCVSPHAAIVRDQHRELDRSVGDTYGWEDLDLGHGFHETRYGRLFTVSTEARFELLMRLLELNFVQAAQQTGRSLESIMREAQQHV